ncbi:MAG: hypothetical protein JWN36_2302 [Microbacteriaceae bacterium]|nr:hypothetical protein [Microbacteriaceae bacterium]
MRDTAEWYATYASVEARGQSAIYEGWALGVASDAPMRALIERMPLQKRQPALVFAVSRLLGAPEGAYGPFRDWFVAHADEVASEAAHRMVQTNEPRRCASLLPALALIPGPLALLEVGASAGLCLYPDRYSYRWNDHVLDPIAGPSPVLLESTVAGPLPIPTRMPEVVWRAGNDLAPLDVTDADDIRWLEANVPPEQFERRERLRAAVAIAAADPPHLVAGDARASLAALAAEAPTDATLVVITSGVLVYLPAAERALFAEEVRALGCRWLSLEGRAALPVVEAALPAGSGSAGRFVLALDEHPLAFTGPHGQNLDWF